MKRATGMMAAVAVVCMAAPALGVGYVELVPWSIVQDGSTGTSHWSHVIDGQTSYHTVNLNSTPAITKVTNLNGVQSSSVLVSSADWFAASGQTMMANGNGFGISGGTDLMWTDTGSDAVWKADLGTGAVSAYVTKAQIMTHTGQTAAGSLNANSITPTGELVWYESTSDSVLVTTGAGTLATLINNADLTALQGNDTFASGIGFDAGGGMYWGDSTSDSAYMRSAGGTLSKVLDVADIIAVSGKTAAGFGDFFGAGDGLMYFYESTGDNIMRFDPAAPVSSLEIYISEAELLAGPQASDSVVTLGWYDDRLTFHRYGTYGLYVVPEPTSLSLLGLGALALLRRRR
ncbi:MAG: PEP-CTERM sorting domain-containing protein [bacterium]|nr:PEP-CTERM sorting domain-containing protein [bacterium]